MINPIDDLLNLCDEEKFDPADSTQFTVATAYEVSTPDHTQFCLFEPVLYPESLGTPYLHNMSSSNLIKINFVETKDCPFIWG